MIQARILAVDDQLYFRVFLEDLLKKEGFEVVTASSGDEALHELEQGTFDLIVTDLVMPGMDGTDLVRRIKESWPALDVVVVTSVSDVATAVEAMKEGASEYLLKPIDRGALLRALGSLLERREMRDEHARLLAENLEYLEVLSRYERALTLFSTLSLESLADRVVEGLCLETGAQGGVLWLARGQEPTRLSIAGVRGLVRVEDEIEELDTESLPPLLTPLADAGTQSLLAAPAARPDAEEGDPPDRSSLIVALRQGDDLLGVVRLSDKLDAEEFDEPDREAAGRFAAAAGQAIANAMQFRALERRSFRDPVTKLYTRAYFDDVVENEIQKANRFGRTFSLVRISVEPVGAVRSRLGSEFTAWAAGVGGAVERSLRTTDLLGAESETQFCLFLPETDALGAAVVKRRLRGIVERCEEIRELDAEEKPAVLVAASTFPADGIQLSQLKDSLEQGIAADRNSLVRDPELAAAPFRGLVDALLEEAPPGRPVTAEQMTRFLLEEVARRPHERGLLFVAPGASLQGALRDGLEALRGLEAKTEVVLVAERKADPVPGVPVTWVSPIRAGTQSPFVIYYGEGPPYALIRSEEVEEEETGLYHTSDPVVVEHLAFQLGRDLGIPIGE